MVNTTEFRLGNMVEVNGKVEVITHIKPNLLVFESHKATRPQYCNYVELYPDNFDKYGGYLLENGWDASLMKAKYLHELQNLYFNKYGEELPIMESEFS